MPCHIPHLLIISYSTPPCHITFHTSMPYLLYPTSMPYLLYHTSKGHWTNTCCSHPLNRPLEIIETEALGIRNAAVRKLDHELGIQSNEVSLGIHSSATFSSPTSTPVNHSLLHVHCLRPILHFYLQSFTHFLYSTLITSPISIHFFHLETAFSLFLTLPHLFFHLVHFCLHFFNLKYISTSASTSSST